jgi:hypothetical protein
MSEAEPKAEIEKSNDSILQMLSNGLLFKNK